MVPKNVSELTIYTAKRRWFHKHNPGEAGGHMGLPRKKHDNILRMPPLQAKMDSFHEKKQA